MKRKLFSAILFGALLTASTSGLTSCKDYDDDISNLQSQIDKLATADQLSAKVSEMQAAISAAQSAAEAKAAAAQTVADAAKAAAGDAAAAAKAAQSTADAAAAAAAEVQKAADKAIADLEAKAATKDELKAAADAAEAAVKAIQNAHAADKAAIEKAIADGLDEVKAEIAKTNEELGKLADRLKVVEDKLAAIEAGEGQEEALKEIQEEVEAIAEVLEDIIGEYTSMVTEVSLYTTDKANTVGGNFDKILNFIYVAQEKNTTFPAEEGVADRQFEFSDKNKDVTTTDSLLIRVSPTNAILNPANVSLINSQGKDLSEFVEVKSVKPYESLITKSVEGNGLWNVEFKVKEGIDRDKFIEAVSVKQGNAYRKILFAVAVSNTESNDVRRVISAYDVEAWPYTFEPARADFQVANRDGAWTDVRALHNRYNVEKFDGVDTPVAIANESGTTKKEYNETYDYAWEKTPAVAGTTSGRTWKSAGEKRSGVPCKLEVAINQPIQISVATYMSATQTTPQYDNEKGSVAGGDNNANFAIKGFYVTLDKDFAIESNPSEWKAWKSYTYENVGVPGTDVVAKLFDGNTGTITITDEDALGDYIGFRVYAVNLDGTLVDPDGRAFYVHVAGEKATANLTIDDLEATLNYDKDTNSYHWNANSKNFCSAEVALTDEVAEILNDEYNGQALEWTIISNASDYGNNTEPVSAEDYTIELKKNSNGKYVKAKVILNKPVKFLDGGTYTAAATVYNANGTELCDVKVNFTKTMPTEAPALTWTAGYDNTKQVFTNAPSSNLSGIYTIAAGSTPQAITLPTLMNSLNYGVIGKDVEAGYYKLTFNKVVKDANGGTKNIEVGAPTYNTPEAYNEYKFNAGSKYAVDGKSHDITYKYNFGWISLTRDYTTGNFVPGEWVKDGASALQMTFNTWSMFEQYALKNPLTLTYMQQGNNNDAGYLNLGYSAGSDGDTTYEPYVRVSGNIVAVSKADTYSDYYTEVDGAFYKFNPTNWAFRTAEGGSERDFNDLNPDNQKIKDYGIKLTIDPDATYVKIVKDNGETGTAKKTKTLLVVATGDAAYNISGTGDGSVNAGTLYKKVGNTYYQVTRLQENGVDEFKFVDSHGNILTNQSEATLGDNDAVEMPNGVLSQTKPLYENYKKATTTGAAGAYKSDVAAWNTVVFNWDGTGANAKARFGTASAKADLGELVTNGYLKITKVATAANDPFYIVEKPARNGAQKYTIKQKVGTLTPGSTGTIYVTVTDCFEKETVITLTYSIR